MGEFRLNFPFLDLHFDKQRELMILPYGDPLTSSIPPPKRGPGLPTPHVLVFLCSIIWSDRWFLVLLSILVELLNITAYTFFSIVILKIDIDKLILINSYFYAVPFICCLNYFSSCFTFISVCFTSITVFQKQLPTINNCRLYVSFLNGTVFRNIILYSPEASIFPLSLMITLKKIAIPKVNREQRYTRLYCKIYICCDNHFSPF